MNFFSQENDFDAFITKRGGTDNAQTETEQTTFYFEVHEKYLRESLDRFAQFFISPLMKRDAINREREAVESGNISLIFSFVISTFAKIFR